MRRVLYNKRGGGFPKLLGGVSHGVRRTSDFLLDRRVACLSRGRFVHGGYASYLEVVGSTRCFEALVFSVVVITCCHFFIWEARVSFDSHPPSTSDNTKDRHYMTIFCVIGCGGGNRTHCGKVMHTTTTFVATFAFVVWTIPSPRCSSGAYRLVSTPDPTMRRILARDCHS